MAIRISEKIVIVNSLISTKREYLTKEQVHIFWNIVDSLLPEGYYTSGNNNSFLNFCEEYPFLVKRVGNTMMINCDITLIERYCRIGVPKKIIKVFDVAGIELNKLIEKDLNRKNFTDKYKNLINEDIPKKWLPNIETGYVPQSKDLVKLADTTTENGFVEKYCLDESEVKQLKLIRNNKTNMNK